MPAVPNLIGLPLGLGEMLCKATGDFVVYIADPGRRDLFEADYFSGGNLKWIKTQSQTAEEISSIRELDLTIDTGPASWTGVRHTWP